MLSKCHVYKKLLQKAPTLFGKNALQSLEDEMIPYLKLAQLLRLFLFPKPQ